MDVIEYIINSLHEMQIQTQHMIEYKMAHPQGSITFFDAQLNIQQLQNVNTFLINTINDLNNMVDNAHKENCRVNK